MDLTDRLVIGTSDSTNEPTVEKGLGYALFFIGDHDDDDSSEMNNDMAQDSEACESREASPVKVTPADADGDCSEASLALCLTFSKADLAGSAAWCGARSSNCAGPGCCSLSIRRATWGGQRRRANAQVAKCSDAQETKEFEGVTEKKKEDMLECASSHEAEDRTAQVAKSSEAQEIKESEGDKDESEASQDEESASSCEGEGRSSVSSPGRIIKRRWGVKGSKEPKTDTISQVGEAPRFFNQMNEFFMRSEGDEIETREAATVFFNALVDEAHPELQCKATSSIGDNGKIGDDTNSYSLYWWKGAYWEWSDSDAD